MSDRIRVAIADDQVLFCSGIQMLVESQPDLEFVGSAYDGEAIVRLVADQKPDVVLMDIRMPKLDGISATEQILAAVGTGRPRIIVLTTLGRDEAVLRAMGAGASGFLMKDTTPDFLLASIRAVHAGGSVIAPPAVAPLLRDVRPSDAGSAPNDEAIASLSAREREIFLLAARGLSTAEIAAAAFVSESTAKSHIASILSKLGLSSRLRIVAMAYENHLIT